MANSNRMPPVVDKQKLIKLQKKRKQYNHSHTRPPSPIRNFDLVYPNAFPQNSLAQVSPKSRKSKGNTGNQKSYQISIDKIKQIKKWPISRTHNNSP